ncbi:D-alanyl-D-alanine carboxypeptidase family protein [Bacillus sp. FJAT-45037]|uniref:D-alanyl-D-alanine carboxypeptidase family protein n=1 Tax=Bacillus sp. FJAT-45037 TaxID=2011007 RepID=UPI000C23A25F|nr:D-alanyl-D-alanine carboxypeptidase family protein [Bacillus sp. FJAT-45037]
MRSKVRRIINTKLILGILLIMIVSLMGPKQPVASPKLNVESEAAILIDGETKEVLYEKNSTQRMYPASITKIITAIVAIEEGDLQEKVTVSENVMEVIGTRVYLLPGEEVTLKKLVQGLMINSGNDAGLVIAEHMDGSEEAFSKRMNQFIRENVGVKDSHFTNPHGLFDEDHYTTAYDFALITQYAMENEVFREIVSTKEMEWIGEGWETTIYNHNRLLWDYEGATGVKNGFVQRSGFTLSTAVKRDDTELIAITLNAPTANLSYRDSSNLFDYGFDHFETNKIENDQLFETDNGKEYGLTKDIFYVNKQEEEVELAVTNQGKLQIIGAENRIIKEVELEKVDNEEQDEEVLPVEEPPEQGFVQWLLQLFPLFIGAKINL